VSDHVWRREGREEPAWRDGPLAPRGARSAWPDAAAQPAQGRAWPLLLITLIAVLYPFEYDTGLTNYSLGDAVVGPVALVVALRSLAQPARWPRYLLPLLLLVLVAIASTLVNALSPEVYFSALGSLGEIAKLVSAGLWMCVMFWLLSEDFSRGFYQLACASALLATGFAVSSLWVTVQETSDYRPTGPFGNTNLYASYLCLNVFLVLGAREALEELRRTGRRLPALLRWPGALLGPVMLPLLLLGILATASRGAMVGCVAGLVLSGSLQFRRIAPRRLAALAAGLLFLGASGAWYVRQEPLVLRRLETTAAGSGPNIENRLELWHAGREAFATHPVLGVGYGQLRNYVELATGNNKPVHQTFISMGAELGAAGLLAFLWLVVAVVRDTMPARSPRYAEIARACRGFVIAILTQGLFTNVQHSRALWMIIGVIAVQAAEQRARSGSGEAPPLGARAPVWQLAGPHDP
jgi:O-antigen ligase